MRKSSQLKVFAICLLTGTLITVSIYAGDSTKESKSNAEQNQITLQGGVLGDLSPFKKIAEDTLKLVRKEQMPEAKARIKDLETAWDNAEETMKSKNPDKWNSIDKSIDRALAQLRTSKPDPASCISSLNTLIAKFTVMNK